MFLLRKKIIRATEVNRLRIGYKTYILTSVDIQDCLKYGGKVIETYQRISRKIRSI